VSRSYHEFSTWQDKRFRKGLEKLQPKEKVRLADALAELARLLIHCRHPRQDPELHKFDPSPYDRVINLKNLYEYRPGKIARVAAQVTPQYVLFIAVIHNHDHEHLKNVLRAHESELRSWVPPRT